MPARYALYYAPAQDSALHGAVTSLFGRDALNGTSFPPIPPAGSAFSPEDWAAVTAVPARYGLHATLKAPFELSEAWPDDERTLQALTESCRDIARRHAPMRTTPLELRSLDTGSGSFLALTPTCGAEDFREANPELSTLEKDCLVALEPFRAPLSDSDIRRRGTLTDKEAFYLRTYGYHRVLDLFRFHMTLTDALRGAQLASAGRALQSELSPFTDRPLAVESISLFRQEERSAPFTEVARFSLGTNKHRNIS